MASLTYWIVANMGLLAAAACTGGRTATNKKIRSVKAVTERMVRLRGEFRRLLGVPCSAVYVDMAGISLNGLILAWRAKVAHGARRSARWSFVANADCAT